MILFRGSAHSFLFGVALLIAPSAALAACMNVGSNDASVQHFRCGNGTEFKVVETTSDEPAAAKILVPGAFDTSEFAAAYIEGHKILKIAAYYRKANGKLETNPIQTLYAFMRDGKVAFASVSRERVNGRTISRLTHNLNGPVESEDVEGQVDVPLPEDRPIDERTLSLASRDAVYQKLGLF